MDRRIMGIETEFGVNATFRGTSRLSPEEVARYLFRKVVAWGRSSNVFLVNGSRLYLDVGSHPEYATAECTDLLDLVAHDKAGELIVQDLADDAEQRLAEEGFDATVYVLKNNVDSRGNSYGSHENYLIARTPRLERITDTLVPFLVTRQLVSGAGRLHVVGDRATYLVSQRADHMWEGLSSATTRSRPIINTRDEPHADPERYRRLHVIVGDSTMSQTTTLMRVGTTDLVLRMLEAGTVVPDLALANPVQAIRDISRDPTGRRAVPLARGGTITALGMQRTLLELAERHARAAGIADLPPYRDVLELWERTLHAVETDDLGLVDTEIEWVMKKKLLDSYAARHGLEPHDERLQQLDLAWHDVHPRRGLVPILQRSGAARTLVDDARVARAMHEPPQTRARLRGDFVRAAQDHRRDFTVDWVHLKLNDSAQRTIVCKDPFASVDERVDDLIEHIRRAADR
ncbi:Pup--protein ligase [Ornithinimicrobium pekingense]|uniref:Pup--protein ligase n=1 Tax=Ornithinimicrobium pekingense TaxID=384677 RepID=A0ABQ2FA16_9MICO|nr:Pup--protein ligase [Ornithinimicrobium pekingense]GGK75443.1 Pup--protein ligase [Ornithinimicrobium pekingense]